MVLTRSSLNKLQATVAASAAPASRNSRTSSVTKSSSNDRDRTRNTRFAVVDDDNNNSHGSNQFQSVSSNSCSNRVNRGSVFTSSARKAALRNHKIYAPATRRSSRASIPRDVLTYDHDESTTTTLLLQEEEDDYVEEQFEGGASDNDSSDDYVEEQFEGGDYDDDDEACDTAKILASLSSSHEPTTEQRLISPMERCLNPVSTEMHYLCEITVNNPTGDFTCSSSYILYNMKNRTYYLFNKITLINESQSRQENIEPSTAYYLQTMYKSYMRDCVEKYINNLLVISQIPQSVETRFLGLVTCEQTISNIFNDDANYYDIDALIKSKSSSETLTGHEMFILTPTTYYTSTTFYANIQDIFSILSGQH